MNINASDVCEIKFTYLLTYIPLCPLVTPLPRERVWWLQLHVVLFLPDEVVADVFDSFSVCCIDREFVTSAKKNCEF